MLAQAGQRDLRNNKLPICGAIGKVEQLGPKGEREKSFSLKFEF